MRQVQPPPIRRFEGFRSTTPRDLPRLGASIGRSFPDLLLPTPVGPKVDESAIGRLGRIPYVKAAGTHYRILASRADDP